MASIGGGYLDPDPSIRIIRGGGYLNKQLIQICAAEGLGKLGVKAELQARLVDQIRKHAASKDAFRFERLRQMIEDPNAIQPGRPALGGMPVPPTPSIAATNGYLNAANNRNHNMGGAANGYRGPAAPRLDFKSSPFYTVECQLGDVKTCEVMQQHRHTVTVPLKASENATLQRVIVDPSLRVMVFCAGENSSRQDVAFPHQSEIKVNGGEVKANLRGLKSKPGSTRPVDITKHLRLRPENLTYGNTVEMTYALTQKKFYLTVYVVKVIPAAVLVEKLEIGKRITEKTVIDEMVNKSRDADIVTTASVLSLKCPLSTLRIDLPCRSISCRHNQCFDASSYLQLQEQAPTWLCPICNNTAPFDSLAVDEYVKNILKKTSRSVDQVTIHPDGKWELHARKDPSSNSRTSGIGSDSDDDLIEVTKSGESVKMGTPQVYKTPAPPSREQSTASSVPARNSVSTSGKRPATVIDLTSSGDEDDEPLSRPAKRPYNSSAYGTPPTAPVYRPPPPNGYTPL